MNRKHLIILLSVILSTGVNLVAQESVMEINKDYTSIITLKNPLLLSNNPAAIIWNTLDSIGQLSLTYHNENGDYKPSMIGTIKNSFSLNTENYRKIGKTMLWGAFQYSKSIEQEVSFTNTYDSYRNTPYLYADTIGGDAYDREGFAFKTKLSTPLTKRLFLGSQFDYKVGLGAQSRDPRAQNKVVNLDSKLGLFYVVNDKIKIGANAIYSYLNDDIDINIVETNATHIIFNLTGLGTYSKHESTTFYRLYKRNTRGGNFQLATGNNIIEFGAKSFNESATDGRKESSASWAAIKEDSRLRGRIFSLSDIYTINNGDYCHQIRMGATQHETIGTEILQELRIIDENYDVYQWTTFSEEDKYTNTIQTAFFSYEFSRYKKAFLRDYSIGVNLNFTDKKENYYLPNHEADYTNIDYSVSFSKLFSWKKHRLDTKLSMGAQNNLSQHLSYTQESFIADLITTPDHHYFASDYINGEFTISYDYKLKNLKRIFINAQYQIIHSDDFSTKAQRSKLELSTGYLF